MAAKKADKSKILETVKLDINKEYGEGSIMSLGGTDTLDVEAISTGCLSLDMALGVGGVPKGRIIEVFGPESSGLSNDDLAYSNYVLQIPSVSSFS